MVFARMNCFFILFFHFLLFDVILGAAISGEKVQVKESTLSSTTESKATATTSLSATLTTAMSPKAKEHEQAPIKADVNVNEKGVEKPLPKKRGILEDLYRSRPENFEDNPFDDNNEPTPEELFAASRAETDERPFFRYNDDSEGLDEGNYFENEGRRKRTVMFDGFYNGPQEYSNTDVELSPEDVVALLNLLEERRIYNTIMQKYQNHWNGYDNTVDAIQADMRDEDISRERPENFYGDGYENEERDGYERYPTNVKRYMITRRRRSDFMENPKLKVPIFRRAIL